MLNIQDHSNEDESIESVRPRSKAKPKLRRLENKFSHYSERSALLKDSDSSSRRGSLSLLTSLFSFIWSLLFATLGAILQWWVPTLFVLGNATSGLNITSLSWNCLGSFVIALVGHIQAVQYQYLQTYLLYSAITGGFCSALTTFGNFIEDTGRLLFDGYWVNSLLNLFLNILIAILAWHAGKAVAKVHPAVGYSSTEKQLENPEARMAFELERQLLEESMEELSNQLSNSSQRSLKLSQSGPALEFGELQAMIRQRQQESNLFRSPWPQRRHIALILWLLLVITLSWVLLMFRNAFSFFRNYLTLLVIYDLPVFDFCIATAFSVSGAIVGGMLGKNSSRRDVQWGTFKVNMVSSLLIGIAHCLLLFQVYMPFGLQYPKYYVIVVSRFITNFCGSESSFAGLINETLRLWYARFQRHRQVAAWNLFYNLFLCLVLFFFVVIGVRTAVLFRYWSPSTARLYLCGGGFFLHC